MFIAEVSNVAFLSSVGAKSPLSVQAIVAQPIRTAKAELGGTPEAINISLPWSENNSTVALQS